MRTIVVNKSGVLDVPIGSIILWFGTSENIPDGYEIYTELKGYLPFGNATVDLTQKGAATHVHSYPADSLSLQANHTHVVAAGSGGTVGGVGLGSWSGYDKAAQQYHSHGASGNTVAAGSHRHTIGNTGSANNLNNYHKLYYIRRV